MPELHVLKGCSMRELTSVGTRRYVGLLEFMFSIQKTLFEITGYWHTMYPAIKADVQSRLQPFIIFSDHTGHLHGGHLFAEDIRANDWGELWESPSRMNWTKANITMWVWQPNYTRLREYYKEQAAKHTPIKLAAPHKEPEPQGILTNMGSSPIGSINITTGERLDQK